MRYTHTPESHKGREENSSTVIKKEGKVGESAAGTEVPKVASLVTKRTHVKELTILLITDLISKEKRTKNNAKLIYNII